jgi:hypothetical protein
MTKTEYLLLYEKYLAGEATPEETDALLLYKDDFELYVPVRPDEATDYKEIQQRIIGKLHKSTGEAGKAETPVRKLRKSFWFRAAAAILIITGGSLFYLKKSDVKTPGKIHLSATGNGYIVPGSNKATLTLSNGKVISLTDAANGLISREQNVLINKKKNGTVEYTATAENKNAAPEFNTISTPLGGQYQLILPDGSRVWLNAASSLKFPSAFTGKSRDVELTGEAYFEVAKNKQLPFNVKFNHTNIEVLGTHFDIKAYDDEETRAVLEEGSIRITRNNQERVLVPGQQAVLSKVSGNLKISDANIEEALAWKNGYFIFHDTPIKAIMLNAARWYDIDVKYEGNVDGKTYGGRVSRYKNIAELLKNLELTGTIHFKVEGRRVIVME